MDQGQTKVENNVFMEKNQRTWRKRLEARTRTQPQTLNPCLVPSLRTAPGYTGR